jgi:thiol:disulfide interchange protein DsbC
MSLLRPTFLPRLALTSLLLAVAGLALGQEAHLRKILPERVPGIQKIDEISKTPIAGLYEVRINGTEILYADAEGNHIIQGQIYDTRQRRNLTEERMDKLLAIDFASLPVKDAFTITRGDGKRRIAIFEDPNCGYCKRFEAELQKIDNVTIHMFLYPILGKDSTDKSRNIWCARDRAKAWTDWMLRDATPAAAQCDTAALTRNVEFGRKHKITGTPTMILPDGSRVPGAVSAQQVEKLLAGNKS